MARLLASASSQYLRVTTPVVTAYPFTLSLWFRVTTAASNPHIFTVTNAVGGGWALRINSATMILRMNDWSGNFTHGTTLSTGVWYHAYFRGISTTDKWLYINGAGGVQRTTSDTVGTPVVTTVGILQTAATPTFALPFDGEVAEVALWNVDVGAGDELAALAKGVSPALIRPQSLLQYWPLVGRYSPEISIKGGYDLTVTGATASAHPRIFYPASRRTVVKPTSGNVTVSPSALTLASSLPSPTISAVQNVTVTPSALTLASSLPTPVVSVGTTVSVSAQTLASSLPTPALSLDAVQTLSTLSLVSSQPSPTLALDSVVSVSALTLVSSLPSPTVSTVVNVTVTPSAQVLTSSLPTPSLSLGTTVSPSALSATFSLPTPTVDVGGAVTITPSALTLTSSVPSPSLITDVVVTVTVLSIVSSVPSPTVDLPGATTRANLMAEVFRDARPERTYLSDRDVRDVLRGDTPRRTYLSDQPRW